MTDKYIPSVGDVVTGRCRYHGDFIGRVWGASPFGMTEIRLDNGDWRFMHRHEPLTLLEHWDPPPELLKTDGSYVELRFSAMDA